MKHIIGEEQSCIIIHRLKEAIKGILDLQKLWVLATQGNGRFYGSLVAFATTADLKTLLFATARATRKYSKLLTHPDVAMVVDTRTNQIADSSDAVAVTALGGVAEVTVDDRQEFLSIYLEEAPLPERVRGIADLHPSQGEGRKLHHGETVQKRAGTPCERMNLIPPLEHVAAAGGGRV